MVDSQNFSAATSCARFAPIRALQLISRDLLMTSDMISIPTDEPLKPYKSPAKAEDKTSHKDHEN